MPFLSPGDLSNPRFESVSPAPPAVTGGFFITEPATWEAGLVLSRHYVNICRINKVLFVCALRSTVTHVPFSVVHFLLPCAHSSYKWC